MALIRPASTGFVIINFGWNEMGCCLQHSLVCHKRVLIKFSRPGVSENSGPKEKEAENAAPYQDFAGQKPDEKLRVFTGQNLIAVIADVLQIIGSYDAVGSQARLNLGP